MNNCAARFRRRFHPFAGASTTDREIFFILGRINEIHLFPMTATYDLSAKPAALIAAADEFNLG